MAENYKHLYEQTKKMLTMYQDNLIPGFRQKIDELEADNERLRKGWAEAISAYSKENSLIPRWIPVTERLPEPETDVLTFCCGNIDILTYRYNRRGLACFMFRDDCGYWKETFGKITHWMPLPEPPKEE
jgi:hypothetical protein